MEPISIFFDYIVKNELDKVKKCIEDKTVDINCQDSEGVTGLCVACYHERFEIIKFLCEKGIDALIVSKQTGSSCLHYAIRTNNYEIIDYLVKYNSKLVNICSKNGDSPLMFACVEGNYDVISLLLSEKADIKCTSNNRLTAYHCLIQRKRNDKDICDILKLIRSCDDSDIIFSSNAIGNTILHLCAERSYKSCIEYLLSLKFPERIRNKSGKTALDISKGECRKILLDSWNKENEIYKDHDVDNIVEESESNNSNVSNPKNKNSNKKNQKKKSSHNNNKSESPHILSPSPSPSSASYSKSSAPPPVIKSPLPPQQYQQHEQQHYQEKEKEKEERIKAIPKSPSVVVQPEIVMVDNNENEKNGNEIEIINNLMEENIPNCSILDIHFKHIFGKDINELSISQLESLESFHLQVFFIINYNEIDAKECH